MEMGDERDRKKLGSLGVWLIEFYFKKHFNGDCED